MKHMSAGTGGSSSTRTHTHLNRTESYQPNNVGSTRYMIPYFPISIDIDAHNLDTVSNPSSSSHFMKDIPPNISQVRTWSTSKNSGHCLECHNGSHLENRDKAISSKLFRKSSDRKNMVRNLNSYDMTNI